MRPALDPQQFTEAWGWDRLLDLIFPPHCVACGQAGTWLCPECIARAPRLRPPLCPHCGRPLSLGARCPCVTQTTYLAGARSVGLHKGPLRRAIHALKYEGLRQIAPLLAALMAATWREQGVAVDAIVAVPLSPARERARGYSQADLLARPLADELGVSCIAGLLRTRDTRSQVGLDLNQRWDNVWGAFRWRGKGLVGQRILLVDDVLTTGRNAASLRCRAVRGRRKRGLGVDADARAGDFPRRPVDRR